MTRSLVIRPLICLALFISACSRQQSDPVAPTVATVPAAAVPSLVTLSGTVTDGTSGLPIANAAVSIPDRSLLALSTTDAAGHYAISTLYDRTTSWVSAYVEGYVQPCAALVTLHGNTTMDLQLVSVAALSASSSRFSTHPSGTRTVTGLVYQTTATGRQPSAGIFVMFAPLRWPTDFFEPLGVSGTVSDSTGHYALWIACELTT
jgi:hypothetical protein